MTVGERLALQQERIEDEQRQQMTALQRRQRRRLEYMQVGNSSPEFHVTRWYVASVHCNAQRKQYPRAMTSITVHTSIGCQLS